MENQTKNTGMSWRYLHFRKPPCGFVRQSPCVFFCQTLYYQQLDNATINHNTYNRGSQVTTFFGLPKRPNLDHRPRVVKNQDVRTRQGRTLWSSQNGPGWKGFYSSGPRYNSFINALKWGYIYTLNDERISENVDSNNDIVVKSWIPVPIQREFHQLSRQNDIPERDMMEPSLQQSAPVIKILIFAAQYPSVYHVFFICKMAMLGCI